MDWAARPRVLVQQPCARSQRLGWGGAAHTADQQEEEERAAGKVQWHLKRECINHMLKYNICCALQMKLLFQYKPVLRITIHMNTIFIFIKFYKN